MRLKAKLLTLRLEEIAAQKVPVDSSLSGDAGDVSVDLTNTEQRDPELGDMSKFMQMKCCWWITRMPNLPEDLIYL